MRCPTARRRSPSAACERVIEQDLDARIARAVRRLRRGAVRGRVARPGPPRAHDRRRRRGGQGAAPGRGRGRRGATCAASGSSARSSSALRRGSTRARVLARDPRADLRRARLRGRGPASAPPRAAVPRPPARAAAARAHGPLRAPRARDRVRRRAAGRRDRSASTTPSATASARSPSASTSASLWRDGIVAGDPHPDNCILCPDGRLCLLDFGLLRDLDAGLPARASATSCGRSPPATPQRVHDGLSASATCRTRKRSTRTRCSSTSRPPASGCSRPASAGSTPSTSAGSCELGYPPRSPHFAADAPHAHAAADAAAPPHGGPGPRAARRRSAPEPTGARSPPSTTRASRPRPPSGARIRPSSSGARADSGGAAGGPIRRRARRSGQVRAALGGRPRLARRAGRGVGAARSAGGARRRRVR